MKCVFKDILEIKNGKNQKNVESSDGVYPIYGSGGIMGYADDYICPSDTVIIGRKGNINSPIYVEEPFWNVDTAFGLIANRKYLIAKYLFYFCKKFDFEKLNKAVTIPSLTKSDLLEIKIDLPDKSFQQLIVDRLNTVEKVIELRQRELSQFDNLIKARFVELFGDLADPKCQWKREKLVDVCKNADDIKCGPFGTQLSKDEYCPSGVAVWEISQINNGFATKPIHFLTDEKAHQLGAYSIKSGDIAMSRKGNVGRCAVFPETMEDGIIHSDVLRIRIDNDRLLPIFMMHQLHYSRAVQHQIELVSSGAIMAGINVTKLKKIEVHIPPINLQRRFVAFVAQVDKSKVVA